VAVGRAVATHLVAEDEVVGRARAIVRVGDDASHRVVLDVVPGDQVPGDATSEIPVPPSSTSLAITAAPLLSSIQMPDSWQPAMRLPSTSR
jgi:hypothetical protein